MPGFTYLGLNLKEPALRGPAGPPAFAHAINKQELIDGVVLGLAREATGPIRPGTWAWTDKGEALPVRSGEGEGPPRRGGLAGPERRRDPGGQGREAVQFTIRTNQGNDERKKVAEIIQQRLKEVGSTRDPDHRVVGIHQGVHQAAAIRGRS